jgi:hypothetical protein
MSCRGKLSARATLRAYQNAIAEGADVAAAYKLACDLYRSNHPRLREQVLRHVVAVIVSSSSSNGLASPCERHEQSAGMSETGIDRAGAGSLQRDVVAAQCAYVAAVAGGAAACLAFDAAKAAYRAMHPGLSGERLDEAVWRALATEAGAEIIQPRRVSYSSTG